MCVCVCVCVCMERGGGSVYFSVGDIRNLSVWRYCTILAKTDRFIKSLYVKLIR